VLRNNARSKVLGILITINEKEADMQNMQFKSAQAQGGE